MGEDAIPPDAERGGDLVDEPFLERALADKRRGGEGQDALDVTHTNQPSAALLHDTTGVLRRAAVVQPGARGSEGGVPGKGQFTARAEDPEPVIRFRNARRQDERGLRQVHPAGQALHLLAGQVRPVEDDCHRVAEIGRRGEHVDLRKRT